MNFTDASSLEKELAQSIRGYSGYEATEDREKTDKRLREYLSNEIQNTEKLFQKISSHIVTQGDKTLTETIKKLIHQLQVLINTLNKPSYQQSSFFRHANLNPEILLKLYQYESQLKNQVAILTDEAIVLENNANAPDTSEFLNYLFDVIDNLNQIIMEREFILSSYNGESI